jgi:predicted Ser/Thr protein kinase
MDARRWLSTVGGEVRTAFAENRSILSFEEYLAVVQESPRRQARSAAQYLRDVVEHFGAVDRETPAGRVRRYQLFDLAFDPAGTGQRVAGQEEVQAGLVRGLGSFVRAGRVNKLILLHGPNGSAKSTLVAALFRAMEAYSRLPVGALYRFHWVFPSDKKLKGGSSLGFGSQGEGGGETGSFAHLDGEALDARLACPLKDHPLLLVPRQERVRFLEPLLARGEGSDEFVLSDYLRTGEPCHFCRQIHDALLGAYRGDWLKLLRHVQVERLYVSARYQEAAVTVEPQLTVDASYRQVTADRSAAGLPPALHAVSLLEPTGPLVAANRGLVEFSDLLKRPLEAFKYLLGTAETGRVSLDSLLLQLDLVLVASANEHQLAAFKELPEFPSFRGRLELVRVPYLRRTSVEREIYDQQITSAAVGKHVAPHATEVAALWAVLTRLKRPLADRHAVEVRPLLVGLTPLEKARLYDTGVAPDRMTLAQARLLRKHVEALAHESDVYPNYEGRTGASAREIKTALLNAAQAREHACLTPMAVLAELEALCRDRTVHEFLQEEVVDGYHDHPQFVRVAEEACLDALDEEIRDSLGLVSEQQYRELFDRYLGQVSHWVKGEKVRNRVTGAMELPDEARMVEVESLVMQAGDDRGVFRRGLISAVGAFRLDHPGDELDPVAIFPDLFRRLRAHYFEERRRQVKQSKEELLRYLADQGGTLDERALKRVTGSLEVLRSRYGYCEHCAKDAVLFLMRKRYQD